MKHVLTPLLFIALFAKTTHSQITRPLGDSVQAGVQFNNRTTTPFSISYKENEKVRLKDTVELFSKHLNAKDDELILKSAQKMGNGVSVNRFQQYFKGIKVEQGAYVVVIKNDFVSYLTGDFYSIDPAVSVTPRLSENEARAKAWAHINGTLALSENPAGELVFCEDMLTKKGIKNNVHLAYKFYISSFVKSKEASAVYVNAENGEILLATPLATHNCFTNRENSVDVDHPAFSVNKSDNVLSDKNKYVQSGKVIDFKNLFSQQAADTRDVAPHAATRFSGVVTNMATRLVSGSYRLEATVATEGYPVHTKNINHSTPTSSIADLNTAMAAATEFTDADNSWTAAEFDNSDLDNVALDVHWGAQRVYDYWKTKHSRNSWDGSDGELKCYIHYGTGHNDAAWKFTPIHAMFYGDGDGTNFGPSGTLDITSHEIGHGVCEATANLTYLNESGALNEAFSDIWAASVERFADPHESDAVAKKYFEIGEEWKVGGPLRNMSDPKSKYHPNTYGGQHWYNGFNDDGGVHINSGVLNYWFYLLVSGGSGTNDLGNVYNVTGIGWDDAEQIVFLGESSLTSGATYADCRTAMINAATTLFGGCSSQTTAVTNAFYAVGVGASFVPCGTEILFSLAGIKLSESTGTAQCPAGAYTFNLPVTLQNSSSQQTDVTLTINGGSAVNNQDFTVISSTVSWAAGETGTKSFQVQINDDFLKEDNENIIFGYTFDNHGGEAIAADFNQTFDLTIADDDRAPSDFFGLYESGSVISSNYGASDIGPFQATQSHKRIQSLYPASDLLAKGLKKGYITDLGYYITNVVNGSCDMDNFTLKLGTVSPGLTSYPAAFFLPTLNTTIVYSGPINLTSANNGFYNIRLSTPYYWDGVSGIIVEACYDNTVSSNDASVAYETFPSGKNMTAYAASSTGSNFCAQLFANSAVNYRPYLYMINTDILQSSAGSTTSGSAYLGPNAEVFVYSGTDHKVLATIKNNSSFDYGCTTVTVDRAGTSGTTFWRDGNAYYLADKTYTVTPTTDNPSGSFDITLYYTKGEHDGWETATGKDWETDAKIVKTKGHQIGEITPSTTAYFNSVNIAGSTTRSAFGNDYSIKSTFNTGFSGFGVGDPTDLLTLPVTLLSFTGTAKDNAALLKWSTASEQDLDRFEVETSKDGINYYRIGEVKSVGNSSTVQQYSFTDHNPAAGINYYRLKQVDANGQFTMSRIISLNFNSVKIVSVYPNPAKDQVTLAFTKPVKLTQVIIRGTDGKIVLTENPAAVQSNYTVQLKNLPAGTYFIEMMADDQKVISKLVKQ